MAEKSLQERFDELKADRDGAYASLGPLQKQLDAALQKHKDDAEETNLQFAELAEERKAEIAALKQGHVVELAKLRDEWDAKHKSAIAELKASVLVPALKDLQQRQAADLAAKHAAELQSLG